MEHTEYCLCLYFLHLVIQEIADISCEATKLQSYSNGTLGLWAAKNLTDAVLLQ